MLFFGGLQRNPFRFSITPTANTTSDLYYDLSLAPANFWKHVRSDGGDIRVTKQDGITPVAREVTAFDAAAKVGSLFVKVDSATSFYVYYGNAAYTEPLSAATYGKNSVWESAMKLLLHGQDLNDSTSNGNNATKSAGVTARAAGKIRGAYVDSVASDYMAVTHKSSLVFTNLSMAMWIKWTSTPNNTGRIVNKAVANSGFKWFVQVDGSLVLSGYTTSVITTSTVASGAWHHIAFSLDSLGHSVQYIDGSSVKTGDTEAATGIPSSDLKFFNRDDNTRVLYASLDEIRVYNRILSGPELATLYSNQNAPGSFWTTGLEESV
jgi:hypothetical protein